MRHFIGNINRYLLSMPSARS